MSKNPYIKPFTKALLDKIRESIGDTETLETLALFMSVDELRDTLDKVISVHGLDIKGVSFWDGWSTLYMERSTEENE